MAGLSWAVKKASLRTWSLSQDTESFILIVEFNEGNTLRLYQVLSTVPDTENPGMPLAWCHPHKIYSTLEKGDQKIFTA